jgi:diguanylate cyclase (GGDEF)-like protein
MSAPPPRPQPARCTVLLVDDGPYPVLVWRPLLADEFEVLTAGSAAEARALIGRRPIDILLVHQRMPGMPGVELLEWALANHPRTQRLLWGLIEDLAAAVDAVNRAQLFRFLAAPFSMGDVRGVLRAAGEAIRRERELEAQALTDPLTGLPNRRAIEGIAGRELVRSARYRSPLALGVIDADHFREINRRYLHPGGDQALITLAATLQEAVRAADAVGRIGGEEFLVVAPETDYGGAVALAERIRSAVERTPARYNGEAIPLTVSGGFAAAESGADAGFDRMKHVASTALREAKAAGRNRCVVRRVPGEGGPPPPAGVPAAGE